jgi:bifunctional DNA-binding transcriptional regulator/antitoxin component of YhaV-PrlF toxin-antitoxin module
MGKAEIAKMDARGRLLVPSSFREVLNLKDGSSVLAILDEKTETISIVPFAYLGENIAHISIEMSDAPGTLSRILALLAKENVDLIKSESIAAQRGRVATWSALVEVSKCKKSPEKLRALLLSEKLARAAEIRKV